MVGKLKYRKEGKKRQGKAKYESTSLYEDGNSLPAAKAMHAINYWPIIFQNFLCPTVHIRLYYSLTMITRFISVH